jgi:hypothetical protein
VSVVVDDQVALLDRDGFAMAGFMPSAEIAAVRRHLLGCPVWPAHMKAKALRARPDVRPVSAADALAAREWQMFAHDMADVVRAPGLLQLGLAFLPLAAAYFREAPLLFSLNAFWSQPGSGPRYGETHGWHRDGDDRKFVALFVYGDDVRTREDGAHYFLPGTQDMPGEDVPGDWRLREREVTGPAGTMFLENGRIFHRGERPQKPRLLIWLRYGVSDPPAPYVWDDLAPAPAASLPPGVYPDDPELRRAIKLVVA